MKVILITLLAVILVFLGGWFATGRDFHSFRDGLSSDFRKAGAEVLDEQDVGQLDSQLENAIKHVHTNRARLAYRKLEYYAEQSAKAMIEMEGARQSLADQKPQIAEAQIKQSEFHSRNRKACIAELDKSLPAADGGRTVPTAADIGDAICKQY